MPSSTSPIGHHEMPYTVRAAKLVLLEGDRVSSEWAASSTWQLRCHKTRRRPGARTGSMGRAELVAGTSGKSSSATRVIVRPLGAVDDHLLRVPFGMYLLVPSPW